MYQSLFYRLRREKLKLLLFACALLAAGCAHDSSDNSQDRPHRHHGGHRGGETESFANPTPSSSGF